VEARSTASASDEVRLEAIVVCATPAEASEVASHPMAAPRLASLRASAEVLPVPLERGSALPVV
jgi:hypothetical protein